MFIRVLWACLAVQSLVFPAQSGEKLFIERGLDATLMLYSDDLDQDFMGSGFVIGADGMVLTNAHVVKSATTVLVETRAGARSIAEVIATDADRDIAVLSVTGMSPGLALADEEAEIGDRVVALGAPLGLGFSATQGAISADPRQIDPTVPLRFLQHDAAINPGSSGGPLINEAGEVIGMNSQIADGSRLFVGISYAISARDISRLVPGMVMGKLPALPDLGLDLRSVDAQIAASLGIEQTGILIDHVRSPASTELAPGDVLLSLDGRVLRQLGDLSFALENAGDTAMVGLWRRGQLIETLVNVTRPTDLVTPAGDAEEPFTLRSFGIVLNGDLVKSLDGAAGELGGGVSVGDKVLLINGLNVTPHVANRLFPTPVLLLIERDGHHRHIVINPQSSRRDLRPVSGNALDLRVHRF